MVNCGKRGSLLITCGPASVSATVLAAAASARVTENLILVLAESHDDASGVHSPERGAGGVLGRKKRLERARNFLVRRHPSIRRQVIDHLRQILAETLKQIVLRHAGMRRQRPDLIGTKSICQIVRSDRLVRPGADPGRGDVSLTCLLELLEQVVETSAQHGSGGTAGQQAAEPALEEIVQTATARASGLGR